MDLVRVSVDEAKNSYNEVDVVGISTHISDAAIMILKCLIYSQEEEAE